MTDWKLFFNNDGTINEAVADALVDANSMLPTGLGVIKNASEERKKKSRMAALVLIAELEKARKKREEIDRQMFQAANRGQSTGHSH